MLPTLFCRQAGRLNLNPVNQSAVLDLQQLVCYQKRKDIDLMKQLLNTAEQLLRRGQPKINQREDRSPYMSMHCGQSSQIFEGVVRPLVIPADFPKNIL